jgi:hypothetical protein
VRPRTAPPANVRQARTRAARVQLRDRQRTHLPGDPEPECRSPGPWLRLRFPSGDDKRGVVRPIEHSLPIPRRQTGSVRLIKPRAREPFLLCGAVRAGIKRSDPCTLTFSSMLAAMIAGASRLCRWLERHLGLRGVAADEMMDRSCSANSSRGWSQQKQRMFSGPPLAYHTRVRLTPRLRVGKGPGEEPSEMDCVPRDHRPGGNRP